MAGDDGRPGRLHGAALGNLQVHLLAAGRFTIPGEQVNPDLHDDVLEAVGLAAAAAGLHVRILDREAGAHHVVLDVIDLAAAQVRRAVLVDVDLDAVLLDDVVAFGRLVFPAQLVGHAGAAATDDADAQPPLGLAFLQAEVGDLLGGHLSHRDHAILPWLSETTRHPNGITGSRRRAAASAPPATRAAATWPSARRPAPRPRPSASCRAVAAS